MLGIAGLTACGDKISGPEGGNVVHSVTVSPASANMNVGDKVTFAASVDAEAGVTNRTVTWSSSNTAVATVDAATGAATAVAAGTASIIAKSVADPNVSGAAVVNVAAGVPATVTIGQINTTVCSTTTGTCSSVPATLNNVSNQLDVTLNVDAGTQKLAGVDLIMNCGKDTVVATQNLSSADLAPISAEEATAPVTLSFNTAAFNSLTGTPAFKNGQCTIKAQARLQNGTQVASSTTQLTLNNVDFVSATMTTTPSTGQVASASDAAGLVWRAGAVTVTAVPVFFSTGSVATATISINNGGLDNAIGKSGAVVLPGDPVATLSGLTPAAGVVTASFPNSTGTAGVAGATVDTLVAVVTTVSSTGNAGPSLTLPISRPNFIRLDNRAPDIATVAPVVNFNVQNAQNGWIGSTFVFKTSGSGAPITLDASTTSDWGGVDVVKVTTQSSPAGAGTWTTFTSASTLAETSSSTAYDLRLVICDALGNCVNATNAAWKFGVDLTPPSLSQTGGIEDGDVFNMADGSPAGTTMSFAVVDTSKTVGVSGSGTAANAILVSDQGLKPDSSNATGSRTVCAIGTASSASGASRTCTAPAALAGTFTLPAVAGTDGQYLMIVTAVDQAGNQSPADSIKYYVDLDTPVITGTVAIPATVTTNTAFAGLAAADSMDIAAGNGALVYGGVRFFEAGTATPTGALFDNALTRQSTVGITLATYYRSLNAAVGGVVPGAAGIVPSSIDIRAIDAAGNLSTAKTLSGFDPAIFGTPAAISNSSTTNGITNFAIDSVKPNPADPGKVRTFYIDAKAFSATSGNPFTQVCLFYQADANSAPLTGAAVGELVKISCSSAAATVGDFNTTGRFFAWQITWTPPAAFTNSTFNVYAVGNTAGLDALLSDAVAVTVNPTPP